ncbi:MAG: hypothetical protein M3O23_03185 [Actinomycetota bacterium]|nr:hypothetical protein [Actinomycetota bacterium]
MAAHVKSKHNVQMPTDTIVQYVKSKARQS